MPGLLPIVVTGTFLILAADKMPEFNMGPTCRAAATTGVRTSGANDDTACKRSEADARGKLEQSWDQFSGGEREHCVRLATRGGSPSYVELLTCLEMSKQANSLPDQTKTPAVR
jgi:hypothetical protein